IRTEPIANRDRSVRLLFAKHHVTSRRYLCSIGLRLPRSVDPPDPAEAPSPRRGKTRAHTRTVTPPSPRRAPHFALSHIPRNQQRRLAIDGRLRAEDRPVDWRSRPTRSLDNPDVDGRKSVVVWRV